MKKGFLILLIQFIFVFFVLQLFQVVYASTISVSSLSLSDNVSLDSSVTYSLSFSTVTSSTLTSIETEFATTSSGTIPPTHMNLSTVSLGAISGITGSNWTLNSTDYTAGILYVQNGSGQNIPASTDIQITLNSITNPEVGDCGGTYYDTCYLQITTFDGVTPIDSGYVSFGLESNPQLTFSLSSIGSGTIENGITTTTSTSISTLPLGSIAPYQFVAGSYELSLTTNAPNGYSIYSWLSSPLIGTYYGKDISPFSATGASWTTPVSWTSPTGSVDGTNTCWIGANTSDTSVTGWSSGSNLWGPLGSSPQLISYSNTSVLTQKNIFFTIGLECNALQSPDVYSSQLNFSVVPSY